MATLADVNNELSEQGNILEETRDSIADVAATVQKQLDFFTGGKLTDLEAQRERRGVSTPSTSAGGIGRGIQDAGMGVMGFLRGLGMGAAGLGGFLLGAAQSFLGVAAGLLKAGIATVAFPFVKNFADDVADEIGLFLEPLFNNLGINITDANGQIKQSVQDSISSVVTSTLIGSLFGLKTGLFAGLITAAFEIVKNRFPNFTEGATEGALDIIRQNFPGLAEAIENNPELSKTAIATGLALTLPTLIPIIMPWLFKFIGAVFALAISGPVGAAIVLAAAGLGAYFTSDTVKEYVDQLFEDMKDGLNKLANTVNNFIFDSIDGMREGLFNFFNDISDEDLMKAKAANDPLREKIRQLREQRANIEQDPSFSGSFMDESSGEFVENPEVAAINAKIDRLRAEINANKRAARDGRLGYSYGAGEVAGIDAGAFNSDYLIEGGPSVTPVAPTSGMTLEEQQQSARNYITGGPAMAPLFNFSDQSTSTQVQNSTNIMGSLGNTQDVWGAHNRTGAR